MLHSRQVIGDKDGIAIQIFVGVLVDLPVWKTQPSSRKGSGTLIIWKENKKRNQVLGRNKSRCSRSLWRPEASMGWIMIVIFSYFAFPVSSELFTVPKHHTSYRRSNWDAVKSRRLPRSRKLNTCCVKAPNKLFAEICPLTWTTVKLRKDWGSLFEEEEQTKSVCFGPSMSTKMTEVIPFCWS